MLHVLLYLYALRVRSAGMPVFCGWCVRGRGGEGICMRRPRRRNIPGVRVFARTLALSRSLDVPRSLSLTLSLWHPLACLTSRTGQVRQRISARGRRKWIAGRTRGGGNQVRHIQRNGDTSGAPRGHLHIRPFRPLPPDK